MFRVLAAIGITSVMAITAGSCDAAKSKPSDKDVALVCATFSRSGPKDILTEEKKRDMYKIVDGGTVNSAITSAVKGYYDGEKLDGKTVDMYSNDRRQRLERKKEKVMKACVDAGWAENPK